MNDVKDRIEEMFDELKRERDELHVKLHLAKLETSEEWQKLEGKLEKLESKLKEIGGATADASREMGAAAKLLGEEIRDGLKKIAKHF
jgi:septation ring formation regulator EzrA